MIPARTLDEIRGPNEHQHYMPACGISYRHFCNRSSSAVARRGYFPLASHHGDEEEEEEGEEEEEEEEDDEEDCCLESGHIQE